MNRRAFLSAAASGTFGLGVLGPAVLTRSLPGVPGGREDFAGWLWIGGRPQKSDSEWRSLFSLLADSGFRGVLVGRAFDPGMADAAHRAGLEYHRWMWILNRAGDTWARENHPEWFTVSRNGDSTLDAPPYVDYYRWVCPCLLYTSDAADDSSVV